MKKVFLILAMLFVGLNINAQQYDDLFGIIDRAENRKKKLEEERYLKEQQKILREKQEKQVFKFADRLRREGVDLTKLTDEDIERLDNSRLFGGYENRVFADCFYTMPSDFFKDLMRYERKGYVSFLPYELIESEFFMGRYEGRELIDADSTVYVGTAPLELGHSPKIVTINGAKRWIEEGDTIRVGRVTFIGKYLPIGGSRSENGKSNISKTIEKIKKWAKRKNK